MAPTSAALERSATARKSDEFCYLGICVSTSYQNYNELLKNRNQKGKGVPIGRLD
jgi:hypothetical protein